MSKTKRRPGRGPTSISDENLIDLHRAYQDYMRTQPWRELNDRNVLLVTHPKTGVTAYCVAMGHWGQEFGLAAYTGKRGLETYRRMTLDGDDAGARNTHTLAATTGSPLMVDAGELKRLPGLGVTYPFNSHPVWIATHAAGHSPGKINDHQSIILSKALRAATDAALQIRAGTLITRTLSLEETDDQSIFPLECTLMPDGTWRHRETTLPPTESPQPPRTRTP